MDHLEELKCVLCFDLFTRPVTIACGHTFCEECISSSLNRLPKCPICKQTVIGGLNSLRVNYALQGIVDALKKGKTINGEQLEDEPVRRPQPAEEPQSEQQEVDPDFDAFYEKDPVDQRLIGLEVMAPQKTFFFTHCVHEIKVHYPHSMDVFPELVPTQQFVGLIKSKGVLKGCYIVKIEDIKKVTRDGILMLGRFMDRLKPTKIEELDFDFETPASVGQQPHHQQIRLTYVKGHAYRPKQPTQISPETSQKLELIERQISYFLNRIRVANHQIIQRIIFKSGIDSAGARLSIDWRTNAHDFLAAIASIIRLNYQEKKVIAGRSSVDQKTAVLFDFLKEFGPHNDPVFLLDADFSTAESGSWSHYGFLVAVLLLVLAVMFPKVRQFFSVH